MTSGPTCNVVLFCVVCRSHACMSCFSCQTCSSCQNLFCEPVSNSHYKRACALSHLGLPHFCLTELLNSAKITIAGYQV